MLKLLSFCQMQSNWIFVKLLFMVENSTKRNCMVENGAVDVAHNWVSCYRLKIATSRTNKKYCSWREEKNTHYHILLHHKKIPFFCLKSNTVFKPEKIRYKYFFWLLLLLCSVLPLDWNFVLKSRLLFVSPTGMYGVSSNSSRYHDYFWLRAVNSG